jgi:hypothetical protein
MGLTPASLRVMVSVSAHQFILLIINGTAVIYCMEIGYVIPPLITEVKSRSYAVASNRLGGISPLAICGRSLL